MEPEKQLTDAQFGAIKRSLNLGRTLQKEHPEISDLYRSGNSTYQIVELLEVESEYGVGNNIAHSAIVYAIAGHEGGFRVEAYEGLVLEEERKRIEHNHKMESGINARKNRTGIFGRTPEQQSRDSQRSGKLTYERGVGVHAQTLEELSGLGTRLKEEGKGIFGRTSEQHSTDSRKGGLISGHQLYKEGRGIHAQTPEERKKIGQKIYEEGKGVFSRTDKQKRADGKKGGTQATLSKGLTLWTDEEKEYAYQLSQDPDFQRREGADGLLIAQELNNKYHQGNNVRTVRTVQSQLSRIRKSLKDKLDD